MKKKDLKAALGRIQPREELVSMTLAKMKNEKEKREERRSFTPMFSRGMRLAGALCAFALVFCIGFLVARQGIDNPVVPDGRSVVELDTSNVANNPNIASYGLEGDEEGEYLIVTGSIDSLRFADVDISDAEAGVLYRAIVDLSITQIEGRSDNFPLETILSEIEADILFYDTETLNFYMGITSEEMTYRLTYDEENGWRIADILIAIG